MEEILASIRRIIADDQSLPSRSALRETSRGDAEIALGESQQHGALHVLRTGEEPIEKPSVNLSSGGENASDLRAALNPSTSPTLGQDAAGQNAAGRDSDRQDAEPNANISDVTGPRVERQWREETLVEPSERSAEPQPASAPSISHVAADEDELAGVEAAGEAGAHEAGAQQAGADNTDVDSYDDVPLGHDDSIATSTMAHGLFSAHTGQSVSSAFNVLAATRLADNSEELLGLAREMIRPLLKTWLDDNLPSMVERMVRAEIERVARGAR